MKRLLIIILSVSLFTACSSPKTAENDSEKAKDSEKANNDWFVLFDGTSVESLRGYGIKDFPTGVWFVEEGMLIANPDTANRDLITRDRYRNFEFEYEWAVDTGSNSGVFFHMQENLAMVADHGNSPNWLDNFELQILDDEHFHDTLSTRSAGAVYDLIAPQNKKLNRIGDFNQAKLIHNDGHVEHWLNGNKVVEFEIGSPKLMELLSKSKFKENLSYHSDMEGHIMLQHHGQKVYFRNLRVRTL